MKLLSRVLLFATPWTVAYQSPQSMKFCRQEYWSGLPFPSPGDLPDRGIEPGSPALEADTLTSEPLGKILSISKENPHMILVGFVLNGQVNLGRIHTLKNLRLSIHEYVRSLRVFF